MDAPRQPTFVDTFSKNLLTMTESEANKVHQDFHDELFNVKESELFDMVRQFQSAKIENSSIRTKIKGLDSKLNSLGMETVLWNTVNKMTSGDARCRDGNKVTASHAYSIKELDQTVYEQIKEILTEIEKLHISKLSFSSYVELQSRLKIEQFLYDLVRDAKMPTTNSILIGSNMKPPLSAIYDMTSLKRNITVLFSFRRGYVNDKDFMKIIQNWLSKLVSVLLHNGTLADIWFIVNHVLHCPIGIGTWASQFIQLPSPQKNNEFECTRFLDNILLVLYMILNPPSDREQFKCNQIKHTLDEFAVLSSNGEVETTYELITDLSEDDMLSLLNQIPFRELFENVLLVPTSAISRTQSSKKVLQKLFAFSTSLVNILVNSINNYNARYKKLTEFIGCLVTNTICIVSDSWNNSAQFNASSTLQIEYDKLLFHTVFELFSFKKVTLWRFLVSLPYSLTSSNILWNIITMFNSPNVLEEMICSKRDNEENDLMKIRDELIQLYFVKKLHTVDLQNVVYLLKTCEKITNMRYKDKELICFITQMVFEATIGGHNTLCKSLHIEGSNIIASIIAQNNIFLVSFLIKIVDQTDEVATQVQNLFSEINMVVWHPDENDVKTILRWLISETFTSTKNSLACLILIKMNWGFNSEGIFYLPLELHRKVAILVLAACKKFDASQKIWCPHKELLKILQCQTHNISYQKHPKTDFTTWAWQIIFSLGLHVMDEWHPPLLEIYNGYASAYSMIDMYQDIDLHTLAQAFDANYPMGLYLGVVMTKIGHNIKYLDVALKCISMLVQCQKYRAAIQLIFYVFPFSAKNSEILSSNKLFAAIICDLMTAGQGWFLSVTSSDIVLQNIAAMIQNQIEKACSISVEFANPLLKLWLEIMLHLLACEEHKVKTISTQVYFIMNVLVQIAFINPHTRYFLLDQIKSISNPFKLTKSKTSWWETIFGTNTPFSFLHKDTLSESHWTIFYILLLETRQFHNEIWQLLLAKMVEDESLSPNSALQNISSLLNIDFPNLNILPIYRWAYKIIDIPVNHPALVLMCQQFFFCYFQRTKARSYNSRGIFKSIGFRFFQGKSCSLLQNLKTKLKEAENFYALCYAREALKKREDQVLFSNALFSMFKTFSVWIDNAKLLELSSSDYNTLKVKSSFNEEKLRLMLQNNQELWWELVPFETIKEEINKNIHCLLYRKQAILLDNFSQNYTWQIFDKQTKISILYEDAKPLTSVQLIPPVKEVDDYFTTFNTTVKLVTKDLNTICESARNFNVLIRELKQLDSNYLNWIPQCYAKQDNTIIKNILCNKKNEHGNCCSGAAIILMKFHTYVRQSRILFQSDKNRIKYHDALEKLNNLSLNKICLATIRLEKCVKALVKKIKSAKETDAIQLRKLGVSLFYTQIELIDRNNESIINYTPAQNIYATTVELLGTEFIMGKCNECINLVEAIAKYPSAGNLISSFFNPNIALPDNFIYVYETLSQNVGKCSPSKLFVLLSKIDVQSFLNDKQVTFRISKALLKKIVQALYFCGTPHEDILPAYEILKKHFCTVLLHRFPQHYSDAVQILLNGIRGQKLCIDIWYETFSSFGCIALSDECSSEEVKHIIKIFTINQIVKGEGQFAVFNKNPQQILETLDIIYNYIMDIRLSSVNLYAECGKYIKAIGIFLAILCHVLVELYLKRSVLVPIQVDSLHHLCNIMQKAFFPFISPTDRNSSLKFPWAPSEENNALFMIQMFTICFKYLHEKILTINCDRSTLSYIWRFYIEAYTINSFRNDSIEVCNKAFCILPWQDFYPCVDDMAGMCKVLQSGNLMNKAFVTNVIVRIAWYDVTSDIVKTTSPDYARKVLKTLGMLLILSGWESSTDALEHQRHLKEVEGLTWHYLVLSDIEELLGIYYSLSDPVNILLKQAERLPDLYVLQFLKHVCCMTPHNIVNELSNQKQIFFMKKYIMSLICCVSQNKLLVLQQLPKILSAVSTLLSDMDIILQDVPPNLQISFALPIAQEVFPFLNVLSGITKSEAVHESVVVWLQENRKSPLLLPCLKASCDCLVVVEDLVSISESCITARFDTKSQDPTEAIYVLLLISSFFEVSPALSDNFMKACSEKNSHLSMYFYIIHRMPQSQDTDSKRKLLQSMIQYIKSSELVKDSETKVILLWDKLLGLCISLLAENELQIVRTILLSLCQTLSLLGESRTRKGIFSIIGFGLLSPLSFNFRLLCCAMSAFLYAQMPKNGFLRMRNISIVFNGETSSNSKYFPTPEALAALEALKNLYNYKPDAVLRYQIDYSVKSVLNPKMNLLDSQKLLKDLALNLFPDKLYLYVLGK